MGTLGKVQRVAGLFQEGIRICRMSTVVFPALYFPRTHDIKPGKPLGAVLVRKPRLDEGLLGLGLDFWAGGCGLILFSGSADGMPWEVLLCTRGRCRDTLGKYHGFKNSYWKIFYEQSNLHLTVDNHCLNNWFVYKVDPMNRLKFSFMPYL